MDADQHQREAIKTEFTPDFVRMGGDRDHDLVVARLIHAVLGLCSEVGELAGALKKHIIYGKALDEINILEENGDLDWYQAVLLHAIKRTASEAYERNIAKLRARYGDAFDPAKALNRNLDAERKALEGER